MAYGVNAPFGLRPISSINGGSWTEKVNEYFISASADGATTYASNIFTGDPVIFNPAAANQGGGTIARYGFNTDGNAGTNAVWRCCMNRFFDIFPLTPRSGFIRHAQN